MTAATALGTERPETGPQGPGPAAYEAADTRTVVRTMVRLKWSLLANGLHQSRGRTAAFVSVGVLALLFGGLLVLGMWAIRGRTNPDVLAVFLTALTALGWAVLPLFAGGGDETIDPSRTAMLPLRPRPLLSALLVSSLLGIGPVFTLLLALGTVVALAHGTAALLVSVPAVLLVVLVCVALSRAVATANMRMLTSRRGRDLALLSGLLLAFGIQAVNVAVAQIGNSGGLSVLRPYTDVLRWVPPASAVDAIRSTGDGAYAVAALQLALTAGALALLVWWWERSLTRVMTAPDASTVQASSGARRRTGGRGLLPAGRTGAVMQRSLRYAWRDPKTKASWATSLGLGLLMPFVAGGGAYSVCYVAGFLGLLMYNQFGQDSSAFWMVAATISDRRDAFVELRARAYAIALVAVPFTVVVVLTAGAVHDDWGRVADALGVALALTGLLIGLGALASVRYPYSVPQDSGMRNVAPGQGALAYSGLLGGMLVAAPLVAPLVALMFYLNAAAPGLLWTILPLGTGYGVLATWLGLRLAARRTAERLPEILTAVSRG